MALTVGQALQGPLAGCRLLAGQSGLDRVIESVGVLEAPDSVNWVRGGELLLTIGYFLERSSEQGLIELLQAAVARNAAALAIKLGRYVDGLSPVVIATAENLALPLIEVPFEFAWWDMIGPVLRHLFGRQAGVLEHSRQVNECLANSLEGEAGLQALPRLLSSLLGCPVTLHDDQGRVLASYPSQSVAGQAPGHGRPVAQMADCYLRPVQLRGETPVQLAVHKNPQLLDHWDLISIEHMVTALLVQLAGREGRLQLERHARLNLIFDLLEGSIRAPETACKRAERMGCDLTHGATAVVADMDHTDRLWREQLGGKEQALQAVKEHILAGLESLLRHRHPGALVGGISDSFLVILPARHPVGHRNQAEAVTVGEEIRSLIATVGSPATATVGVGRSYDDPTLLHKSFREAQEAVRVGRVMGRRNAVVPYEQLGVWRVLGVALEQGSEQCSTFVRETLGPLLQAKGDLFETLRLFLETNGSLRQVAKSLRVHPSTVKYRLNTIRRKYGVNWNSPDRWLQLQLAIQLHQRQKDQHGV